MNLHSTRPSRTLPFITALPYFRHRSYKPKDKSLVEGAVRIAYQRIYSVLDNKIFHTLEELNDAIKEIVELHNNTKFSNRPYSRRDLFEEIEREALTSAPNLAV